MNSKNIVESDVENVKNNDDINGKDEADVKQILNSIDPGASTPSKHLNY